MLTLEYLSKLYQTYQNTAHTIVEEFSIGGKLIAFNTAPAIMGIINLSADSRYRESVCVNLEMAHRRAKVLTAQGADLIDVGVESSFLNAEKIGPDQQTSALIPVVRSLKEENIAVSIETYYPDVASKCLAAGADVINLVGSVHSRAIYPMVADYDAAVVICYIQGKHARSTNQYVLVEDPMQLMYDYFCEEIEVALSLGVKKIIIDSGIGFKYKNFVNAPKQHINFQMHVILNSFRLRKLGFPICNILPSALLCFGAEVLRAEGFFAVLAALSKTDMYRTHEVSQIRSVLDTMSLFGSFAQEGQG